MAARWLRLSWHSSDSDSSTSPEDIGAVLVGNRKPAEERELSRLRAALHGGEEAATGAARNRRSPTDLSVTGR